uniref:Replication initiator protein n=1 Tax=Dulem virus 253 TaxID=3145730 RepID=A0AAU8B2R1_9VIRU
MPCLSPLTITVKSRGSVGKSFFNVPCRQCMCCRLKKVQSLRMMSDLYLYDRYMNGQGASFVTLTYSDNFIPLNNSGVITLRKSDFQKFNKRFRINLMRNNLNIPYKFIACGEYGGKLSRPHYHIIMLGITQAIANEFVPLSWNHIENGISDIGSLAQGGLNYVLKYCTKTSLGKDAKKIYDDNNVERPFICHSKSLELDYFERNLQEIEDNNFALRHKGKLVSLPNYYRKKYDVHNQFNTSSILIQKKRVADSQGLSVSEYDKIHAYCLERELVNSALQGQESVDKTSLDVASRTSTTDVKSLALDSFDPIPF